jgi:hypothetical protein
MVSAARQAASADFYAVAAGTKLPFEDASFELVVAYKGSPHDLFKTAR